MDLKIACGFAIKDEDMPVIQILEQSEHIPSVREIVQQTGLPEYKVLKVLRKIRQQQRFVEGRKKLL